MSKIFAIMVTYRRPDFAESTSRAIFDQTLPPDHLWVVDNDPSEELSGFFSAQENCTYLPQASNLGPAGGIAVGMTAVLENAGDDDWILLVDDDDPPHSTHVIENLSALINRAPSKRLGGVALTGGLYDARRGVMRRILDEDLSGILVTDCLAGNQCPMYSIRAIRDVGTFDVKLFFGFEELEFGLRLRRQGWDLLFDGHTALELRRVNGRMNLGHRSPRRSDMPAWRKYYSARNALVIAWRYGSWTAVLVTLTGALFVSPWRELRHGRPIGAAFVTARGAFDAMRGRLGKTVEPGSK